MYRYTYRQRIYTFSLTAGGGWAEWTPRLTPWLSLRLGMHGALVIDFIRTQPELPLLSRTTFLNMGNFVGFYTKVKDDIMISARWDVSYLPLLIGTILSFDEMARMYWDLGGGIATTIRYKRFTFHVGLKPFMRHRRRLPPIMAGLSYSFYPRDKVKVDVNVKP